jgi:hypothetical protein
MGRNVWMVAIIAVAVIAAVLLLGWKTLRPSRATAPRLQSAGTPLVRTDYSDPAAWARVRELIGRPTAEGFLANVEVIEDPSWAGTAPAEAIRRLHPAAGAHALVILADAQTMHDPEHSLLCLDPRTLQSLRVIPSLLWSIENNLSLANLDWRDFAEEADKDGVLRGFRDETGK